MLESYESPEPREPATLRKTNKRIQIELQNSWHRKTRTFFSVFFVFSVFKSCFWRSQNSANSICHNSSNLEKIPNPPGTAQSYRKRRKNKKMSSRQKRKQARQNGAKAAGTKSPAGIQKSSANSLKHGLTGKAIVLTNESQSQFDDLHQTYVVEFRPESGVEMDLIDQMVAAQWRLRRIWRMQTAALDLKMDRQEAEIAKNFQQIDQATRVTVAFTALANEEKSLDLFLRYETAYTRMYQRALNTLLKLRRERPEPPAEQEVEPEKTNLRNDPEPRRQEQHKCTIPPNSQMYETTPDVPSRQILDNGPSQAAEAAPSPATGIK
jgi:hypothetical protein